MDKKLLAVISKSRSFKSKIESSLSSSEYIVEYSSTLQTHEKKLIKKRYDLLIISGEYYKQDLVENKNILERISVNNPITQIIFAVEEEDIKLAIDSLKKGIYHYIKLPLNKDELKLLIKTAIDERPQIIDKEQMSDFKNRERLGELIGNSTPMQKVYEKILQASSTDIPILILGETGTGKDLVAQSIHRLSIRKEEPFLPVNLGALPPELVASELFGHEKGAFTGALKLHQGVFEHGTKGTVFLDEIDTINEKVQVSLLRLLEQKKFNRLGGRKSLTTKARLIAASNEDLEELVNLNSFRMDLFYRLDVFRIVLPPLRERLSDIPLIINEMIAKYNHAYKKNIKNVDQDAIDALMAYEWPGNVRELKNLIQRAVLLCNSDKITMQHLPIRFENKKQKYPEIKLKVGTKLEYAEKELIKHTIAIYNNRSKAAEVLGISRRALYNKIYKYNL